jgi:hypothetical protein
VAKLEHNAIAVCDGDAGAGAQPGRLLKFHAPENVFGIDSMAEAAHAAVRLGALRHCWSPDPHWTSTPPPTAPPPARQAAA